MSRGLAALLVALPLLAGCGIKGDLQRPPPMWGSHAQYDREQAAERERKARQEAARRAAEEQQTPSATTTAPSTPTQPAPPSTAPPAQ